MNKSNQQFLISGFSEAVFVVHNIEASIKFYCQTAGWQLICQETPNLMFNSFWQLPVQVMVKTALVSESGNAVGAIRLVEISDIEQVHIRANSQIWDVGGIFDVNVRVKNCRDVASKLAKYQWFGVNEPVPMEFGPFKVIEWLAKSHDGITHALIERIAPALEKDEQQALFSALFNASMVVNDHESEKHFFSKVLCFETLIHQHNTFAEEKSNVFGLPFELVASSPHVLSLLSADGSRQGTIELASFPELTGNDFSANAKPYNLGISCLRFPVSGLNHLKTHLEKCNVKFVECNGLEISPYGIVNIIAVLSPAGNRIELFEATVSRY
jgi:hypothetical protein